MENLSACTIYLFYKRFPYIFLPFLLIIVFFGGNKHSSCLDKKVTNLFMVSRFLFVLSSGSEFHTQLVVQVLQDLLHIAVHCLCGEFFFLRSKGYGEGHGFLLRAYL